MSFHRYLQYLFLLLVLSHVGSAQTFSNITVRLFTDPLSFNIASLTCQALGGWLTMPYTAGYQSVVAGGTAGTVSWIGGQRSGLSSTWQWTSPPFTTPKTFSQGSTCVYSDVCAWKSGSPTATGDCMQMDGQNTWVNLDCTQTSAYTCELPVTTTYECVALPQDTPTSQASCVQRGGWLATLPSADAANAMIQHSVCSTMRQQGSRALIGLSSKQSFEEFRWAYGYLAKEAGGFGRLFARGHSPSTVTYAGFGGITFDNGEPNNAPGNEVSVEIHLGRLKLNDVQETYVANGFICEKFAGSSVTPSGPPTTCGQSPLIFGSSGNVNDCTASGVVLIQGNFTASAATFTDADIRILASPSRPTMVSISGCQLTDSAIALVGTLKSGSVVSVTATRVIINKRVAVLQPDTVRTFFNFVNTNIEAGAMVLLNGNFVQIAGGSTDDIQVITATGPTTNDGTVSITRNIVSASGASKTYFFVTSSGTTASGSYDISRNTVSLLTSGWSYFWFGDSLTVTGNGLVDYALNTIVQTGSRNGLAATGIISLRGGSVSWRENSVSLGGDVTPFVIQVSGLVTSNGTTVAILDNAFTGTRSQTLLNLMSGLGTLRLRCNMYFGDLLESQQSYLGKIPTGITVVYESCRAVTTTTATEPSTTFFVGNAVAAATTPQSGLTTTEIYIIIGVCVGALIFVFIIIIVILVIRRRRQDKVRGSHSKSHKSRHSSRHDSKLKRRESSRSRRVSEVNRTVESSRSKRTADTDYPSVQDSQATDPRTGDDSYTEQTGTDYSDAPYSDAPYSGEAYTDDADSTV